MKKMFSLIAAAALAAMPRGMENLGTRTLRSMGLADDGGAFIPTSRNGGRRTLGNRHAQRQARKARNVRRHRQHCRG